LNFERALYWIEVGAQPTDTVRTILSREGVLLMSHLRKGMRKGAFDEATANQKFEAWKKDRQVVLQSIKDKDREAERAEAKSRQEVEKEANKAKAEEVAKKRAEKVAAAAAEAEETQAEEEAPATESAE
jgi:small subunit ribosomal protein S16